MSALGRRIRELRKQRGLSLEQLAAKSTVGLATLSRIENGKNSGTFRTHQRIADAFNLTLPELYRDLTEPEQEAVLMDPATETVESFNYDEKASAIMLASQVAQKQMLPQLLLFKSGSKTPSEKYSIGTERWLFCLEGALTVKIGDEHYALKKDGTLYFKASIQHQFINEQRATAKLISVMSPVSL